MKSTRASRLQKAIKEGYGHEIAESLNGPLKPLLVANFSNVLNIVDEAMEIVAQALKLQMFTAKGERRQMTPQHLYMITKALALIKVVYHNQRVLPPQEPPKKDHYGSYEDMIKQANSETKQ